MVRSTTCPSDARSPRPSSASSCGTAASSKPAAKGADPTAPTRFCRVSSEPASWRTFCPGWGAVDRSPGSGRSGRSQEEGEGSERSGPSAVGLGAWVSSPACSATSAALVTLTGATTTSPGAPLGVTAIDGTTGTTVPGAGARTTSTSRTGGTNLPGDRASATRTLGTDGGTSLPVAPAGGTPGEARTSRMTSGAG